jgi:hypothetical protein
MMLAMAPIPALARALLVLGVAPSLASAHPGHGSATLPSSVAHYLLEPEHLLPGAILLGLLVGLVAVRRIRREARSARRR